MMGKEPIPDEKLGGRKLKRRLLRRQREHMLEPFRAGLPAVAPVERMDEDACASLLEYVRAGGYLSTWSEIAGISRSTAFEAVSRRFGRDAYNEARKEGAEHLAEALLEVGSTPYYLEETIVTTDEKGREVRTVKRADAVEARKLCVRTGLELLKAWSPEKYGQRMTLEAGGQLSAALTAATARVRSSRSTGGDVIEGTVSEKPAALGAALARPAPEPDDGLPDLFA